MNRYIIYIKDNNYITLQADTFEVNEKRVKFINKIDEVTNEIIGYFLLDEIVCFARI